MPDRSDEHQHENKIRVGIIGATGYTAFELILRLLHHPHVSISLVTSRAEDNQTIDQVHPALAGRLNLPLVQLDFIDAAKKIDCAFCCLPHGASADIVAQLLSKDIKVVDFSADYRLNDVATYQDWYAVEHPDAARVGNTAYGLPELFFESIADAELVANPGCFPTSAILPLAPLIQQDLIEIAPIIIDSKTGVSGAGRKAKLAFHFPECNESVMAYGVGQHRHTPEIDHIVFRATGRKIEATFTPHLIPMDRGILSTIYVQPKSNWNDERWIETLRSFYCDAPFIRVVEHLPATRYVAHTNFCDISVRRVGNQLILISAIDNLVKGASGAAIQNFNIMYGFDQTTAVI